MELDIGIGNGLTHGLRRQSPAPAGATAPWGGLITTVPDEGGVAPACGIAAAVHVRSDLPGGLARLGRDKPLRTGDFLPMAGR